MLSWGWEAEVDTERGCIVQAACFAVWEVQEGTMSPSPAKGDLHKVLAPFAPDDCQLTTTSKQCLRSSPVAPAWMSLSFVAIEDGQRWDPCCPHVKCYAWEPRLCLAQDTLGSRV